MKIGFTRIGRMTPSASTSLHIEQSMLPCDQLVAEKAKDTALIEGFKTLSNALVSKYA
jgi:hypothetical protein